MEYEVKTGYGYVLDANGKYVFRYEQFKPGMHTFDDGCTIVEVPDKETLYNTLICNPPSNNHVWVASKQAWEIPTITAPETVAVNEMFDVTVVLPETATSQDVAVELFWENEFGQPQTTTSTTTATDGTATFSLQFQDPGLYAIIVSAPGAGKSQVNVTVATP